MATRTITGNIRSLTDSAVATGTVTFQKLVTSTTGSTIHQHGTGTATTDSNGDFSIALAVPATGSYRYWMTLPNGTSFYFNLASGASVNVATLIIAETITDQDAVVEALAGYEPVLGNPASNGYVLSSTTAGVRSWVAQSGGGAVDSVFGRTGAIVAAANDYSASEVLDDSTYGGSAVSVATSIEGLNNDITAVSNNKQDSSTNLSAIAALTWAANSLIWLTGTATASVQALAAHIVTFLQSATAADARTAIGALPEDAAIVAVSSGRDLASTDAGKILECTGTFTLTCPNGLDTGFQCAVVNISTGVITLAATTTLTTKDSAVTLASQYGGATVYHAGSNVWRAIGDLS